MQHAGGAQQVERLQLVAGPLEVDVEGDMREARVAQVREAGRERDHVVAPLLEARVGQDDPAAVAGHVELDDVDARGQCGVEGGHGVAGRQLAGALVADPLDGRTRLTGHAPLIDAIEGNLNPPAVPGGS